MKSQKVSLSGVARYVEIQVGLWSGMDDIEVVPLDDYHIVVELELLDRINALLVCFTNAICVLDP